MCTTSGSVYLKQLTPGLKWDPGFSWNTNQNWLAFLRKKHTWGNLCVCVCICIILFAETKTPSPNLIKVSNASVTAKIQPYIIFVMQYHEMKSKCFPRNYSQIHVNSHSTNDSKSVDMYRLLACLHGSNMHLCWSEHKWTGLNTTVIVQQDGLWSDQWNHVVLDTFDEISFGV